MLVRVVSGYQSPVRVVLECSNITPVESRAQVTVQFKFFLISRDFNQSTSDRTIDPKILTYIWTDI